jgi:hypothetical protein
MSPIKEPNYFASEIRPGNVSEELQQRVRRDMDALKAYFRARCPKAGLEEWFWNGKLSEIVRERQGRNSYW